MARLRPAPYQLVALTKLLRSNLRGILIADGVGVGKTIAAGYVLKWLLWAGEAPGAVIAPPGLVSKWLLELRGKLDIPAFPVRNHEELVTARSEVAAGRRGQVYVLPYSMLKTELGFPIAAAAIDEVHNMRNEETQLWQQARSFTESAHYRIGLSATPINNEVDDLGSIYALLLTEYHASAVRAAIRELWADSEYNMLAPVLTRFTKEELKIHFAHRRVENIRVEYSEKYAASVIATIEAITGRRVQAGKYPIEAITYMREAASCPATFAKSTGARLDHEPDTKLGAFKEVMTREQRLIVFCQYRQTADYLHRATRDRESFVLSGDVPIEDRDQVVHAFRQAVPAVLYLTSVGTEGLDLQFCNAVVNYDLSWNPMVLEQRIGRVDRIGQSKDEIRIYNFHVTGSIDDRILTVLSRKLSEVSGTPLSPPPITHDFSPMYDTRAEENELAEARRTLEALRLSNKLRTSDVQIVKSLSFEACDPLKLTEMAPLSWLANGPETAAWLSGIDEGSERLRALIGSFQKVVNSGGTSDR